MRRTVRAPPSTNRFASPKPRPVRNSPGASSPARILDALGEAFRRDGIHFNDGGLSAAADLWFASLYPSLAQRNRRLASP